MLIGSRQAHHEAVITTLSDKIVSIKNESSLFRHKEVRLKMDDALNALQELHEKASNAIAAQSLPPPSTHSASSSAMKEHAKNWSMYLIEPDEWTGISALAGFATLKRFTEPPPPPPARSLLALAGHKVRGTKPIADENPEDYSLDDDVDFDHPRSKMEYGVHNINSKGISKNNKTPDPLHVVGQSGVMGAKLTREVVVIIDALCGTILKSPTYHNQKMCEYALDCIAVLVTNGYIYGTVGKASNATSNSSAAQDGKENSKEEVDGLVSSTEILEFLIETVCKCSDMTWIGTQEGMVRVLLALAVSPRCAVHETYLLKIVRSIFHVYLVAKDANVKHLAKSALFNITTAVFQRMEAYDIIAKDHALKAARQQEGNSLEKGDEEILTQTQQTLSDVLRVADGVTSINEDSSLFGIDEEVEHDADVIRAVANLREHQQNSSGHPPNQTALFASQFHTDGYLLFRAICKLSAKSLPEDNADGSLYMRTFGGGGNSVTDPLAFQTKLMSLELLVHVFDHSDEVFMTGERFIYAIQHYLCVSLLKNCMSIHTDIGHAALKIFLVLVYKFKSHLKSEIEVFVANIFLRVLESRSTSYAQKSLVLEALRALCADPQLLTSLFLNYDCDYDAVNLYENIVNSLTRVSRGKVTTRTGSRIELQREADLALYALEVLIVILRAMLSLLDLPGGIPRAEAVENNILLKSLTQLDIGMAAVDAPKIMLQRQGSANTPISSSAARAESMEENFTDTLDRKRTDAQKFDIGSIRFKQSIQRGMDFFISENMCEANAPAIAQFLYQNNDKLDKTQIGELLGREAEFSLIKNETSAEKGGPGIAAALLQSYVQFFDFRDVSIDDAIRDLLSTFRLPGEAQKIDRIMEQFARKYSDENYHHHVTASNSEDIESFNHESSKLEINADTIFVLSFSIIMLNTDLHNPNIREENRMNEDQFLRNNRGIGTKGSNLSDEYLLQIYHSIAKRPITLREDDDARLMAMQRQKQMNFFDFLYGVGGVSEEQLREEQRRETDAVMHASYKLFKYSKSSSNSSLLHNQHHQQQKNYAEIIEAKDAVIPMFEAIWGSLLSALSTQLEASNNRSSTTAALTLCLNGFVYAIRISANTNLDLIRNAYVNGLAKFTLLGNLQEMKRSNLEAIRVLLSIAVMDGEVLCQSWGPILQCVSEVARLRDMVISSSSTNKFISSVAESSTEVANSRLVLSAIQDILIDKVFTSTVQLTAKGILHFVEEMIRASKLEMSGADHRGNVGSESLYINSHPLDNNDNNNDLVHISESQLLGAASDNGDATSNLAQLVPAAIIQKFTWKKSTTNRIYCLQKLVEVADYNMDVRPRLVWTQIWELLGKYFVDVCTLSDSANIRAFAMDSLRQLSFKFLRKREFADFNFQRLFLKPFADIMCHKSTSTEIKELLLRCVDAMIRTYGHNLRSGWKVFFGILTKSSSDSSLQISKLGLAILQRILDEHVHDLCDCFGTPSYQQHSSSSSHEKNNINIDLDPKNDVIRNADAQDFISLQRASLSFIPSCVDSNSNNNIPIGLSMRALCHLSCYADLIGCGKVLPPTTILIPGAEDNMDTTNVVANVPNHDQELPNDSRKLSKTEAEEMILWRPLLDGLAMGLSSSVSSTSAGVGHIVQRGCIMTLRAILLRHGHVFSYNQWHVILTQILLPSFFKGAINDDRSNYKNLIGVENGFAYIGGLKALPPSHTSKYLKRFEEDVRRMENAPPRPFGIAELLVEATFADLRQGGDGDIGVLARKLEESNMDEEDKQEDEYLQGTDEDDVSEEEEVDFPYPESWIATTCCVCLGTLVDLLDMYILKLEDITEEDNYNSMSMWNIIHEFFQKLISGERFAPPKTETTDDEEEVHSMLSGLTNDSPSTLTWYPCEALSTLACHEFARLPSILSSKYNNEELNNEGRWWKKILASFHNIIDSINEAHTHALQTLMECREAEVRMYQAGGIQTPYGPAALMERKRRIEVVTKPRQDLLSYIDNNETAKKLDEVTATTAVMVRVLKLEWGAILYEAQLLYVHEETDEISENEDDEDNQHNNEQASFYLNECVPRLKILAATASVMGRNLYQEQCSRYLPRALLERGDEAFVKSFMTSIQRMCNMAHKAFRNKTLAHAFAEYMRLEWGHNSLLEVEEFLKNTKGLAVPVENQRGGVGMHYLVQEAATTNAYVVYLSSFMLQHYKLDLKWDFASYSEPLLIGIIEQVLSEYMCSERDSQHLHQHQYDPNANLNDADPRGIRQFYTVDRERNQVVIFSTAFSDVVAEMLGVIKQFEEKSFRKNFQVLFPLLCDLIEAKHYNIRTLLKDIMMKHMGKHTL